MSTYSDLVQCLHGAIELKTSLRKYKALYESERQLNERLLLMLSAKNTDSKDGAPHE